MVDEIPSDLTPLYIFRLLNYMRYSKVFAASYSCEDIID